MALVNHSQDKNRKKGGGFLLAGSIFFCPGGDVIKLFLAQNCIKLGKLVIKLFMTSIFPKCISTPKLLRYAKFWSSYAFTLWQK